MPDYRDQIVPSESDPSKQYTVRHFPETGRTFCNCPDFTFASHGRKPRDPIAEPCKHVAAWLKRQN